jgi:hypothetical protein
MHPAYVVRWPDSPINAAPLDYAGTNQRSLGHMLRQFNSVAENLKQPKHFIGRDGPRLKLRNPLERQFHSPDILAADFKFLKSSGT